MANRKTYPTDLTEYQWSIAKSLVPEPKPGPNPWKYPRREIVNAIFYKLRSGCSWRMLPNDLPPWETVYAYFHDWSRDGTWERLCDGLREFTRMKEGRQREPSIGLVDSQSVKSGNGGEAIGYDRNKKVKGRKRHILTDALGLLVAVLVTAADVQDRNAMRELAHAARAKSTRIEKILVDKAYNGDIVRLAARETGITIECSTIEHKSQGFEPEHLRWRVERTFGWETHARQLSREYDRTVESSESWLWIGHAAIMLRRFV